MDLPRALSPGPIDTVIFNRQVGCGAGKCSTSVTSEMAKATLFFISDDTNFTTASDLVADGRHTQI